MIPMYPHIEFGAHLHSHPSEVSAKINAAYKAGCRRFDGALKGYGGCPMAEDDLVGNLPTELIIAYLQQQKETINLNEAALKESLTYTSQVFGD